MPAVSSTSAEIIDRVVHAILAGRLKPGTRLGEVQLGELFNVSRTRAGCDRVGRRRRTQLSAERVPCLPGGGASRSRARRHPARPDRAYQVNSDAAPV